MTNAFIGLIRKSSINEHIFVVTFDGNEAFVLRNLFNHFPAMSVTIRGITEEKAHIIGL